MAGWIILVIILTLVAVLAINTARRKLQPQARTPIREAVDADGAAERLAGAIEYKTISYFDRAKMDMGEFDKLHAYLKQSYPLIHQNLSLEITDMRCLMYCWAGSDESLEPAALLAHQDVVPVDEEKWTTPPFEGTIRDGYVYGRGALDMKGQLIAVMESVEQLLKEGYAPRRSVYLLFGSDEECMGDYGAKKVSRLLESRGVRLHYVFDEGGAIQNGSMMGVPGDIALIGVSEKGIMNLKLTARGKSGHASMPPAHTAVGGLADAVRQIERHQMKSGFNETTDAMLDVLTPYMKGAYKLLFANRWLFGGLLKKVLSKNAVSAALVRTTYAPTQLEGSNAPNVLAGSASAVFNIRIAPGQTDADVLAHVGRLAGGVEREVIYYYPPSPPSDIHSAQYGAVAGVVGNAFPEMAVAPFLMVATTDSRHYHTICDHIFKFVPFPSIKEDLGRVHSEDERIEIESLGHGIAFYMRLIRETCS